MVPVPSRQTLIGMSTSVRNVYTQVSSQLNLYKCFSHMSRTNTLTHIFTTLGRTNYFQFCEGKKSYKDKVRSNMTSFVYVWTVKKFDFQEIAWKLFLDIGT